MIQYTCPKCGSTVAADDARAGQNDTCPNCGNINVVPQAAGPEPQPQAPQPEAPQPEGPAPEPAPAEPAGPTPTPVEPAPPGAMSEKDARMWGVFCHLAGFAGIVVPYVGNIVAPLIIWMVQRDKSPYVDDQGKEAVNFQITMSICAAVAFFLVFVFIGFFLLPAVVIFDAVMIIIAAIKANEGQRYRYPISIRFIK